MRGVISAYHCDTTVRERLLQGLPVPFRLDGGVAFDAGSQTGIVAVGEIKVGDGGFGGHLTGGQSLCETNLTWGLSPCEVLQLFGSRQMRVRCAICRRVWYWRASSTASLVLS